jgi:glycosyltransferase involved in cell wall biosynthesis
VSVVVSCFNYERYVGAAIASALAQADSDVEVIAVDDGSSDGSREVIESFGDRVTPVFMDNGGQASALNAGFAASCGERVIFLDADDVLLPGAAGAVAANVRGEVAKAHGPLPVIDADGRPTGEVHDAELPEGDLREEVLAHGPLCEATMPSPAMSGNAFARWLLERVMPIPEEPYRIGADEYLFGLAPAFGSIVRVPPLSLYRMHGENAHRTRPLELMLTFQERHHEIIAHVARESLERAGRCVDRDAWARSAWWPRTGRVAHEIASAVPPGERVALIDGGRLGIVGELRGRAVLPFPEANGAFAGPPADDRAALEERARLQREGVRYFAVAWPAFWFLEEYPSLAGALRKRGEMLAETEDVVVFGPGAG